MTKREQLEPGDEHPRLRLDIHLNLEGLGEADGPLAWLAHYAKAPDDPSPGDELIELAGSIYQSRRLRDRFLNTSLLGEPVWDMLLALYCFSGRGEALSVSGLCHAAGVPQSTALRWVQVMEHKRLVRRTKDPKDGRRSLISLTDECKQLLHEYLSAIRAK